MPLAHERRRRRPVAAVVALAVAGRLACAQRVGAVVHCAGAVHDLGLPLVRHGKGLAWGLVLWSGLGSSGFFFLRLRLRLWLRLRLRVRIKVRVIGYKG
jgi:hypothetical protein